MVDLLMATHASLSNEPPLQDKHLSFWLFRWTTLPNTMADSPPSLRCPCIFVVLCHVELLCWSYPLSDWPPFDLNEPRRDHSTYCLLLPQKHSSTTFLGTPELSKADNNFFTAWLPARQHLSLISRFVSQS